MLVLPYPPSTNRIWRNYRGITVSTPEYHAFKQEVAYRVRQSGIEPLSGLVSVSLDVFRPRRAGDLDGRLKSVLDSLNGYAWGDDSQIVEIHMRRYDDKHNPRVEIDFREV